jgi:nitrite reductase/ring-hydroxylating ferredoxin subunit
VVLYRDRDGEATCVRDVCPHRSAPLSMGDVEDGQLRCFYHGWGFGKQGECESVPTGKAPTGVCVQGYAVAEHENMLFVWRGNPLAADARKLPSMVSATADAAVVDTTLDYDCEWTEVVSRFAGMPHLHWLHESAAPPLASLLPMPLASLPARGSGSSYRTTAERGTVPNIVRHVGASGFEEEVHVVPVGPARCRVLLRQRLPKEGNPVLAMLLQVPGALALLTVLVQNWNFQVAIEDEQQQKQQQATGAAAAAAAEPYFSRWSEKVTSEFGMTSAFGQQQQDSPLAGTYGLKRSYIRDTPQAQYPPLLKSEYAGMVERFQAAQQSLAAGMLATPAAIVTIKTVGPAFAALKDSGLQ